jgi:hypothetical protein
MAIIGEWLRKKYTAQTGLHIDLDEGLLVGDKKC